MHSDFRFNPRPARLLAAALFLLAPPAFAGILYGIETRSYNGRSGEPTHSDLAVSRDGYFGAYCANGTGVGDRRMIYPLDVPDNFQIFNLRVWGEDVSTSHDLQLRLMESCQPFLAGGIPETTELASATTNGNDGHYSVFLFAGLHVVANSTCAYWLEARFAANEAACAGLDLALTRIRILVNNPDVIFRDGFTP